MKVATSQYAIGYFERFESFADKLEEWIPMPEMPNWSIPRIRRLRTDVFIWPRGVFEFAAPIKGDTRITT